MNIKGKVNLDVLESLIFDGLKEKNVSKRAINYLQSHFPDMSLDNAIEIIEEFVDYSKARHLEHIKKLRGET